MPRVKQALGLVPPPQGGQEALGPIPIDPSLDRLPLKMRGRTSEEFQRRNSTDLQRRTNSQEYSRRNGSGSEDPSEHGRGRFSLDLERPADFRRRSASTERSQARGSSAEPMRLSQEQPFRINMRGRKSGEITRAGSDPKDQPFRINMYGRKSGEIQRPSADSYGSRQSREDPDKAKTTSEDDKAKTTKSTARRVESWFRKKVLGQRKT